MLNNSQIKRLTIFLALPLLLIGAWLGGGNGVDRYIKDMDKSWICSNPSENLSNFELTCDENYLGSYLGSPPSGAIYLRFSNSYYVKGNYLIGNFVDDIVLLDDGPTPPLGGSLKLPVAAHRDIAGLCYLDKYDGVYEKNGRVIKPPDGYASAYSFACTSGPVYSRFYFKNKVIHNQMSVIFDRARENTVEHTRNMTLFYITMLFFPLAVFLLSIGFIKGLAGLFGWIKNG
jgi:hypothetical protein